MPFMTTTEDQPMPIAVVGLSYRFPGGANSEEALWDMLANGRNAWSEVPKDRMNAEAFYHPDNGRKGTFYVRGAHFLEEDIAAFDAPFFSISANEAKAMDPQQRMLLEATYEAYENAGIRLEDVVGSKTACFVGSLSNDYGDNLHKDMEFSTRYHSTGSITSVLANRISWFFDLKGPSVMLDTACSSSLVAFHLACQSLRSGEATSAIVGGSAIILSPDFFILLAGPGFLGPDGKCHSFDNKANGYGRGEGVASLILKPLDAALRDGDPIRAIIRGTATNHDGKTPGIALPNQAAQEDLIHSAYRSAGLSMSQTGYFEAHGTGTQAGDPIETGAIGNTIGATKSPGDPLLIGSVKSNIGHLEGASGLAGIVKAILILEKGLIPATAGFESPNPKTRLEEQGLQVVSKLTPWPHDGLRRISVNSFGFGGANAHVILDDAYHYLQDRNRREDAISDLSSNSDDEPPRTVVSESCSESTNISDSQLLSSSPSRLFVFSSHHEQGCASIAQSLQQYLGKKEEAELNSELLDNLSYTLSERRSKLMWKSFVVASSATELSEALQTVSPPVKSASVRSLAFVFSGQGAQWATMGRELLVFHSFRTSLESAAAYLKSLGCEWDLIEELVRDSASSKINQSAFSQPICTTIQVALVELLAHLQVRPTVVVGHSSGEIAAAYALGAVSRESAWKIAYHRGRLCDKIGQTKARTAGAMMAANLSEQEAQEILEQNPKLRVVVACINSPSSVTLSGDRDDFDALEAILAEKDVFARRLKVEHAYHSPHMEIIAEEYRDSLRDVEHLTPKQDTPVRMFSSVTASEITAEELTPDYWVKNMVSPVRFSAAVQALLRPSGKKARRGGRSAVDVLLEVGPHSTLKGPLKQILDHEKLDVPYFNVLTRGKGGLSTLYQAAGGLFLRGVAVDILQANRLDHLESHALKVLTDLPSYPWIHSHRFWYESRLSYDYRHRAHARHHLLGAPTADHNTLEPRWRNYLRVSDSPWIREHVVQSRIIYPGAGFIVMAIEAASQLADASKTVKGFELRDVQINRALQVPEDEEGVETMLHLRPYKANGHAKGATWEEFVIYSYQSKQGWQDHARGLIVTHYHTNKPGFDQPREAEIELRNHREQYLRSARSCSSTIAIDDFYDRLGQMGMQFGPGFRNMSRIQYGQGQSVCELHIPDTRAQMPYEYEFKHLIHPITLDNIFHMVLPSRVGSGASMDAHVPVSLQSLYISADIKNDPGTLLAGQSTVTQEDDSGFGATVVVSDSNWDSVQLVIHGLELKRLAAVSEHDLPDGSSSHTRKVVFHSTWKEDIDFIGQEQAARLFTAGLAPGANEHTMIRELEQTALIYMKRCLGAIQQPGTEHLATHHQLFVQWMQEQVETFGDETLPLDKDAEQRLIEQTRTQSIDGSIMCQVGDHLEPVLEGRLEPLEVLLQDNLLHEYYAKGFGLDRVYHQMSAYLDRLVHKYPNMSFLEIGAGTGGATLPVLQTLGGHGDRPARFQSYTFTDISSGFFGKAKAKFDGWDKYLSYQKLNIENDPEDQGFQPHTYDVIIAANVLHATNTMDTTMAHVRKLLKPGGKLVMIEITQQLMRIPMIMGILPGWWLGEDDGRHGGPTLNAKEWDALLHRQGFKGVEIGLADYAEYQQDELFSVIVSTAEDSSSVVSRSGSGTLIVQPEQRSQKLEDTIINLGDTLSQRGHQVSRSLLADLPSDLTDYVCIVLLEYDTPILANVSSEAFTSIQRLLLTSKEILWVTKGAAMETPVPEANLIVGLARSIRAEQPNALLSTLDLSPESESTAERIAEILQFQSASQALSPHSRDYEFVERDGSILISRLEEIKPVNAMVVSQSSTQSALIPFTRSKSALKLEVRMRGLLDSLQFTEDEEISQPLPDDEVEVEVKAAGVNFKDVMVAMGKVSGPLGLECSGRVTRIGRKVTKFRPGDRVWTTVLGAYRSRVRCHESLFHLIPAGMSYETAASLPLVYMTVYYSLFEVARMRRGEKILIHAASGGVGQAAIILAQTLDAEIFATVGSDQKKQAIMDLYGIPEDHIFNSRDLTFAKGIKRMTEDRGVDVVLNSLAGEALRLSFQCLAMYGRFIELGKTDILGNSGLEMAPFNGNITFASVDIAMIMEMDRQTTARILAEMAVLLRMNVIKEIHPVTVYDYAEVETVFRTMQSGSHVGKLVLRPTESSIVKVDPKSQFPIHLSADATYLLVGGLGGLGRSIAQWMVDHGAKNLVFISRSGPQSPKAQELESRLRDAGAKVAIYACDVGDKAALQTVLRTSRQTMPPIRGVIQGAMVLQDSLFGNMTAEKFHAAIRPKVQGSWNLHELLPHDLDFFTMLSSSAGIIGSRGQGNYAAGNTYQDALAAYRRGQGLAASTIDLGVILDVGYVAENAETQENVKRWGFVGIPEREFLQILRGAIASAKPSPDSDTPAQLTTGLGTGGVIQADRGGEFPYYFHDARFSHLRNVDINRTGAVGASGRSNKETQSLYVQLEQAKTLEETHGIIGEAFIEKVSKLLLVPVDYISPSKPLHEYGVDSLVAVEIRNWVFHEARSSVSVFDILSNDPISALCEKIGVGCPLLKKLVDASLEK
ncbi:type I polyketide synthase [Aspergillus clavatus NRRL 1]|uniref:Polyketide synthase, putative n=1 Tax=Aspergillus clavatus (strain ATCC 1007 / CBS 513.65 / DSM 816 / NCTC 3887 / NRRL 1 / QM 1276 / 107) TaxID=344612 RepID=A1CMV8_ASPCL|nr:polyketide synthase, putative [Aspergillus clavatus NRRL 1]EAW08895.1 polyketide synthase, putative [Aspergillus clavatus NRRL 1]